MKQANHRVVNVSDPGTEAPLEVLSVPVPRPAAGEVLVRVHAAGVNLADAKQARGVYDLPEGATTVPGVEISGEIVDCGPGAHRYAPGDEVCALVLGGGYAEYCVVPEVQCLPIPRGVTMLEAAALPETVFTVWMALFEQARLVPGERVLIHGGAGGIGTTAIQMVRAAGGRVIATAGSDERCRCCVQLGAEIAINYNDEDFGDVVVDKLGPSSVDVVLDTVGGPHINGNLRVMAVKGRLCYLSGDGGRAADLDLLVVMQKRLTLTGVSLRRRPVVEKGRLAAAIEHRVWPWVERGELRPSIGLVLPLEQAAAAHAALLARQVNGKAVLTTAALRE